MARSRLPRSSGAAEWTRAPNEGLRREEVAELAGVSVDYLVRLEQGRASTPSAQVIAALARALQLTNDERDHLYRLARLVPSTELEISDHIPPGLQRVLHRLGDTAAAVFAADWQLVWWNRGWTALLGDPSSTPPALRNFARDTFPIDGDAERKIVLLTAAPDTEDHTKLQLAVLSGVPDPTRG